MVDKLMTAGTTGEAMGVGTGLLVSGAVGSKVLNLIAPSPDYVMLSLTTVAGESIAAGDVVGMFRLGIRKGYGLQTGSSEIDSIAAGLAHVGICGLSATLFVKVYIKSADSKLYAQAFKVDANAWTITEGAEVTVANYVVAALSAKVRMVNATTFAVGWIQDSDKHAYCIGGSVDATPTITLDAGGQVEWHNAVTASGVGETGWDFKLCDTNKLMFAFKDGVDASGHIVFATLIGTAITVATAGEALFIGGSVAGDDISISTHSPTRAEVFYEYGATTGGYNVLIKIAGTTFSIGTAFGAWITGALGRTSSEATTPSRGVCAVGNAGFINLGLRMTYVQEASYLQFFTTMFVGTNVVRCTSLTMLNPWMGIVTFSDTVAATIKSILFKLSISGFNHWTLSTTSVHAFDSDYCSALSTDKKILAVFFNDAGDSHHGHILLYDVGIPLGLAQAANNGGESLGICLWGMSDVQPSNLIANLFHFMNPDGTLSIVPNGVPAGHAYSTTQIFMEGFSEVIT